MSMITAKICADILGVHHTSVYNWIAMGKFDNVTKDQNAWQIPLSEVMKYLIDAEKYIPLKEFADESTMSEKTLRRWIVAKKLRYVRGISGRYFIHRDELEVFKDIHDYVVISKFAVKVRHSRRTVLNWIHTGKVKGKKFIGHDWYVHKDAIETAKELPCMRLEKEIEYEVLRKLRSMGAMVVKYVDFARRGGPDRLVIGDPRIPHPYFIEFKRPDGNLSKGQESYIADLRKRNAKVFIITSSEEAEDFLHKDAV